MGRLNALTSADKVITAATIHDEVTHLHIHCTASLEDCVPLASNRSPRGKQEFLNCTNNPISLVTKYLFDLFGPLIAVLGSFLFRNSYFISETHEFLKQALVRTMPWFIASKALSHNWFSVRVRLLLD